MLRIRTNIKHNRLRYEPITLRNGKLMSRDGNVMVPVNRKTKEVSGETVDDGGVGFSTNDIIQFNRVDGKNINFSEIRAVQSVEHLDGYDRFVLNGFGDVEYFYKECSLIEKSLIPGEDAEPMLLITFSNEHFYVMNRDNDKVDGFFDCSFSNVNKTSGCVGDLIFYNDMFLLKIRRVAIDGTYEFSSADVMNCQTTVYVEKDGEVTLLRAMTPMYSDGTDMKNSLILFGGITTLRESATILSPTRWICPWWTA